MDVADTLREVSVALIKDGKTAFTHRSFDQASTNHPNPIVFELPRIELLVGIFLKYIFPSTAGCVL
jgi:hypothetical protein